MKKEKKSNKNCVITLGEAIDEQITYEVNPFNGLVIDEHLSRSKNGSIIETRGNLNNLLPSTTKKPR